jgi:uncharacterized protein YfaP (DUF2135 family)
VSPAADRRPRLALAAALVGTAMGAGICAVAGAAPRDPAGTALAVRLESPRGGQTAERVASVRGRVEGYAGSRVTLVVNGVPLSVAVEGGRFEQPQVLSPGANSIRAVVEQNGASAEDSVAVYASVPAKDLRVTLTWDTPGTDVDLWVTGPDGEKVMYSNRQGKAGGVLDTDVTTGFGPETYTQARAASGTYRVQAHYFRGAAPTRVTVTTVRFEGTPEEERREFHAVLWKTGDVAEVGEFSSR